MGNGERLRQSEHVTAPARIAASVSWAWPWRATVERIRENSKVPADAEDDTAIAISDVGLTLESRAGPVEILKNVSLDVPSGRSLAIVGPSGSGKSSLLMIMAGLERPTMGGVVVAGHEFNRLGEDALARVRGKTIGIVFQAFHLVPTMTALENVALPMELAGRADAFARATDILAEVGLASRLDHFPAQLSGGEQQRVALARALGPAPDILLADEPTGNLDGKNGAAVIDLLFGMQARRRTTLVLVTHDLALADRCERVVSMADGRIVGVGTAGARLPAAASTGQAGASA